jgi:hypothetical protein
MTTKKPELERNPPEAFAAAFKSIGGVAALAKWARSSSNNRAAFYALFSKLFPVEMKSDVNLKANVTVENEKQLQASMVDALARVIKGRRLDRRLEEAERAKAAGITIQEGESYQEALERTLAVGGIIDHIAPKPVATITHDGHVWRNGRWEDQRPGTIDNGPQPAPQQAAPPRTEDKAPEAAATPTVKRVHAAEVVPLHRGPSIPGLCAGAALDGGNDTRSNTDKAMEYYGGVFGDGK